MIIGHVDRNNPPPVTAVLRASVSRKDRKPHPNENCELEELYHEKRLSGYARYWVLSRTQLLLPSTWKLWGDVPLSNTDEGRESATMQMGGGGVIVRNEKGLYL